MGKRLIAAFGLAGLVLVASNFQAIGQDKKKGAGKDTDAHFVMMASTINLAEIEHGKLAEEKASDEAVKKYGRQMVEDHSKSNEELRIAAKKGGYKLATQMDKEHQAMQKKLQAMKGADFDRHYMMHMVEGHQKAIKLFETQASSGSDADLKAFASKSLPTLQKHLAQAKAISGEQK